MLANAFILSILLTTFEINYLIVFVVAFNVGILSIVLTIAVLILELLGVTMESYILIIATCISRGIRLLLVLPSLIEVFPIESSYQNLAL